MSGKPHEIVRPRFRMWLRPDGIVQLEWGPGVVIDLDAAVASTEAMAALTGGRRSPLLVDAHDARTQDRSTRLEFARRSDLVSALALVVGTPLSRLMGKLSFNLSPPTTPKRLFDDEASAVAWLQEFLP